MSLAQKSSAWGQETPHSVSLSAHTPAGRCSSIACHCLTASTLQKNSVGEKLPILALEKWSPWTFRSETSALSCGLSILPNQSLNSDPWQTRSLALSGTFGSAPIMHLTGFYLSLSLQFCLVLPPRYSPLGCPDTCRSSSAYLCCKYPLCIHNGATTSPHHNGKT